MKIKFRIYRTFRAYIVWQLIHQFLPVSFELLIFIVAKRNDIFWSVLLFFPILLPFNILCLFRDSIVIKKNRLYIKTAYLPSWLFHIDITTITDLHYCKKDELYSRVSAGVFNVKSDKRDNIICFVDNKDVPVQISTKDHATLYDLLKAREKLD